MIPVKPTIEVPNDNKEKVMWNNGYVVGYSKKATDHKVLWDFGFVPNSLQAKAFGLSLGDNKQIAVLADERGVVIKKQKGFRGIKKSLVVPKKPKINVDGDDVDRVMWH